MAVYLARPTRRPRSRLPHKPARGPRHRHEEPCHADRLIAPPWIPVPPPGYGGTEEVIGNLARGLAALGHDVVLFTVGESTCPVPRQWLFRSPAEPRGDRFQEAAHVLAAYQALAGQADIIHDHTDLAPCRPAGPGSPGRRW